MASKPPLIKPVIKQYLEPCCPDCKGPVYQREGTFSPDFDAPGEPERRLAHFRCLRCLWEYWETL